MNQASSAAAASASAFSLAMRSSSAFVHSYLARYTASSLWTSVMSTLQKRFKLVCFCSS